MPGAPEPPPVAPAAPVALASRLTPAHVVCTAGATAPATPAVSFATIVPIDLSLIFTGLGRILPAVTGVADQTGAWDHVGASRRPQLSDGGSASETITDHRPPAFFAYELTGFTNALGRLVAGARGEWSFAPAGTGAASATAATAIVWRYGFLPRRGCRPLVRLAIAPLWTRYMHRALGLAIREVAAARESR